MNEDMSPAEILGDPMIALLNASDGVSPREFAQLLQSATSLQESRPIFQKTLDRMAAVSVSSPRASELPLAAPVA